MECGIEPTRFDVRVFDQGRVWVVPDGSERVLSRMSAEELWDVALLLEAHRDYFYVVVLRREVSVRLALVAGGPARVRGDPVASRERPAVHVQLRREREWDALGRGPQEWLASTTLMRAIRRGIALRSAQSP